MRAGQCQARQVVRVVDPSVQWVDTLLATSCVLTIAGYFLTGLTSPTPARCPCALPGSTRNGGLASQTFSELDSLAELGRLASVAAIGLEASLPTNGWLTYRGAPNFRSERAKLIAL